ncbi:MAG: hypothetical protein C5S47_05840 [Candidatus Methanogasteraceae archaeon]|nr:MAG: hypothetical protein C5S47_05840 [ANME-2 cluster archaeon]
MERDFRKENGAVSPVVGVILMVAITVILASVIGAFVFGLGPDEPASNIDFKVYSDSSGTIKIDVMGGDCVPFSTLNCTVDGNTTANSGWPITGDTIAGTTIVLTDSYPAGTHSVTIIDTRAHAVLFWSDINVA